MSNVHPVHDPVPGKAAREALVVARFADLVFLD